MVLGKYSLRHAISRPGRSLLTLLSVVIGVAAVVSVTISTGTTRRAYEEMVQTIAGRAQLEIAAFGGAAFDANLLPAVRAVPGVQAAVPTLQRWTTLYLADDRRVRVQLIAVDPQLDSAVRDYQFEGGRMLKPDGDGVLLEASFARNLGLKVGDEVKFLAGRRLMQQAEVVGLLNPRGAVALHLAGVMFAPLETARGYYRSEGRVDMIQVVPQEGVDVNKLRAAIAAVLPEGIEVRPPAVRSQVMEETLRSSTEALRLTTAFSLLLAAFIILNTFLMSVGERRRQLAIIRAVGATGRQISSMILYESLAMGVIGTLIGIGAGIGGAYVLSHAMTNLVQVHQPPMRVGWLSLLLAAVFGLGVSLVGALMPAFRAQKVSPLEGLRTVSRSDMEGTSYKFTFAGTLIVVVSSVMLTLCILGYVPVQASVSSAVALMLGVVLLVPTVLENLSQVAVWFLRPLAKIESGLALRQILRHRARSTLTVGVLFVASSTGIGMANAILDSISDLKHWSRHALAGDYFVRAMMPSIATGLSADVPEGVEEQLRQIPGVTSVDAASFAPAKAAGRTVVVIAREFRPGQETRLYMDESKRAEAGKRLREGDIVIGSVLAQRAAVKVGDMLPVDTREGLKHLRVAGIANEYMVGGLAIYMQRDFARKLFGIEGTSAYIVDVDHKHWDEAKAALRKLTDERGLLLNSREDLVSVVDGMVSGIDASLWGVLLLGMVVAAIGVVNTLTMNVLEQTRELGLLRIIAMTRSQVRATVLAQAAIIGAVGIAPGTVAGIGVSYLLNLASKPVLGRDITFNFRPTLFVLSLVAGLAVVILAAWLPARRATSIEIGQALQYE